MNALRVFLRWLLGEPPKTSCIYCDAQHYNECADARDAMEMAADVGWRCVDGTHIGEQP